MAYIAFCGTPKGEAHSIAADSNSCAIVADNSVARPFHSRGQLNPSILAGHDATSGNAHPRESTAVTLDAVTKQLEEEGIASFVKSFEALLGGVGSKRSQLAGAAAN